MGEDWKWYVGTLPGLGECIFEMSNFQRGIVGHFDVRHITLIRRDRAGQVALMQYLLAAEGFLESKGASMAVNVGEMSMLGLASPMAIKKAQEAYGYSRIISATPADLGKAPKLSLVK